MKGVNYSDCETFETQAGFCTVLVIQFSSGIVPVSNIPSYGTLGPMEKGWREKRLWMKL
jgi:hypothetical protein